MKANSGLEVGGLEVGDSPFLWDEGENGDSPFLRALRRGDSPFRRESDVTEQPWHAGVGRGVTVR